MEENKKKYNNNFDDFGDWLQDVVQDAVDALDISGLGHSLCNTVNQARSEVENQFRKNSGEAQKKRQDRNLKKPVDGRQPMKLRKLPGKWSGPVGAVFGGIGLAAFGACSLGFGIAAFGGAVSTIGTILESVFIPLTLLSGVLCFRSRFIGKRAKRIEEYVKIWGENSFMMLEELASKTGYSLKRIRKDVCFLVEQRLWPNARLDEEQTCLMLTEEAGRQYDAAMQARDMRAEEEKLRKKREQEKAAREEEEAKLPSEERKLLALQRTAGTYLDEIKEAKHHIRTGGTVEKINRLELLLSRILVSVQKHPENLSDTDRLVEYYLPSITKLVQVYAEMEQQPVQGDNIAGTRKEIEESLDRVNQALEEMFDDMYQGVAMDISSDIRVLETMLAKDGWGEQRLRSQGEDGRDIWR